MRSTAKAFTSQQLTCIDLQISSNRYYTWFMIAKTKILLQQQLTHSISLQQYKLKFKLIQVMESQYYTLLVSNRLKSLIYKSYLITSNIIIITKELTESAVIKREGGTKSNFSPFLIFFKATKPLSPTSTFCMPIFWGGSPDSDSHFWRSEEFSNESTSHPHVMTFWVTVALEVVVSFVVETEHLSTCLFRGKVVKEVWEFGLL